MKKIKNIIPTLFMVTLISACAGQPNPELENFLKNAVEELKGKSAEDIVACAGLPDATVDLKNGKQILSYSNVTTRLERDPLYGHHHHGCSLYTHNYYCGAYDHSFLGHHDWIDVVQKGCRVGFWMNDSKVEDLSFELTSPRAKGHCARIIKSCVPTPEGEAEKADAPVKAGENL